MERIENPYFDGKLGVCLFDDPRLHASGWAAHHDEEEPWRIENDSDLGSDAVWLMNLNYSLFYDTGFITNESFRRQDYFNYDIESLLNLAGMRTANAEQAVVSLSQLFNRIMYLTSHHLTIETVPPDYRKTIRDRLQPPSQRVDQQHQSIFEQTTNNYSQTRRMAYGTGSKKVTLYPDPVDHCRTIMQRRYPAGSWDTVDVNKIPPRDNQAIREFMDDQGVPMLMRITYRNMDPDVSDVFNPGDNVSDKTTGGSGKQWMTSFEVELLLDHADITVYEVLRPADYFTFPDYLDEPQRCSMSLAYNIFATNLWMAASKVHPEKDRNSQNAINPINPFIRAADRINCFESSLQMVKNNWGVTGYGAGKIRVNLDEHQREEELGSVARHHNLIPPPGCDSHAPSEPPQGQDWIGSDYLREAVAREDTDTIVEMDRAIINHLDDKNDGPVTPGDIEYGGDNRVAHPSSQ